MKKIYLVIALLAFTLVLSGCEQGGYIKTDDCRNNITINESDYKTIFNTFTCTYSDNNESNGYCCLTKMDGNNNCVTSYCYEKGKGLTSTNDTFNKIWNN